MGEHLFHGTTFGYFAIRFTFLVGFVLNLLRERKYFRLLLSIVVLLAYVEICAGQIQDA